MPYLIQAQSREAGKIKGLAAIFLWAAVEAAMHFWPARATNSHCLFEGSSSTNDNTETDQHHLNR